MDYRRFGNKIIARIDKGEEILEKIKEISLKEDIRLAEVTALGAINDFTAGVFKRWKRSMIRMISKEILRLYL